MGFSYSLFFIIFVFLALSFSYAEDDTHFSSCRPFDCGNLETISYPFWTDYLNRPRYCGYGDESFKLNCLQNQHPVITISAQEFQLLVLNQSRGLVTIQRVKSGENYACPEEILINNVFNYSDTAQNITLFYGCGNRGLALNQNFTCRKGGRERFGVFFKDDENECGGEKVETPVGKKAYKELMGGISALNETILEPFDMKYFANDGYCKECKDSGWRCGSNNDSPTKFACYCPDRPQQIKCEPGITGERSRDNVNLLIIVPALGGAAIFCLLFNCCIMITPPLKKNYRFIRATGCLWKFRNSDPDIKDFEEGYLDKRTFRSYNRHSSRRGIMISH